MTGKETKASPLGLRISFNSGADVVDALIQALGPKRPSFVYERTSTRTRRPVRTFIGVGGATTTAANGTDAFGNLRQEIAATAPGRARAVLTFLSYEVLVGSELEADTPRELLIRPDALIELDHETGTAILTGDCGSVAEALQAALAAPGASAPAPLAASHPDDGHTVSAWTQNWTERGFVENALALKEEMALRQDVAGAALSVELSSGIHVPPLDAYRALRCINPSTCMFFVESDDFALWGATSLPVLSVRNGRLVAETDGATRRVEAGDTSRWVPNSKEIAEYDLVVSALRDDLDGVINADSLRFIADREPRQYFNLQHLFAEIQGELASGVDAVEALRRLTPHGAATGYPKPGAVALIDRFDARPRGPYAGAIGIFGSDGSADVACVIRSAWKVGSTLRTRAGAKIVAESDPASEYRESALKTLPLRRSIAQAGKAG